MLIFYWAIERTPPPKKNLETFISLKMNMNQNMVQPEVISHNKYELQLPNFDHSRAYQNITTMEELLTVKIEYAIIRGTAQDFHIYMCTLM